MKYYCGFLGLFFYGGIYRTVRAANAEFTYIPHNKEGHCKNIKTKIDHWFSLLLLPNSRQNCEFATNVETIWMLKNEYQQNGKKIMHIAI